MLKLPKYKLSRSRYKVFWFKDYADSNYITYKIPNSVNNKH